MSIKTDNAQDAKFIAVDHALNDLNKFLDDQQPLTAKRFHTWIADAASESLFSRMVFGVIEWDKRLGRPTTSSLAAGFDIEVWWVDEVMMYTPQGAVFLKLRVPYEVSTWDGKDDSNKWRVNFFVDGLNRDHDHLAEVRFKSKTGWTPMNEFSVFADGFRRIQPSVVGFNLKDTTFLPTFEVVLKGFADL